MTRTEDFFWRGGKGFLVLASGIGGVLAGRGEKPVAQIRVCAGGALPVVQTGVVAGDQVSEDPRRQSAALAVRALEDFDGVDGAGGRMRFVLAADALFDMRVRVVRAPDVVLESGAVLAEVVPESGEFGP